MTAIDPEKERKRLAEVYADMSDGELEKLAGEVGTLSDVATETLRAEISQRGLTIAPRESVRAADEEKDSKRVTIRQYLNLQEALLAKSVLDSAAIECFLFDENIVRIDWFWSNAVGGIKLRVRQEDAAAAIALLDQHP